MHYRHAGYIYLLEEEYNRIIGDAYEVMQFIIKGMKE